MIYFNYEGQIRDGKQGRRPFLSHWWPLYTSDSRWTPPPYTLLHRELDPGRNPHLARLQPLFLTLAARTRSEDGAGLYSSASLPYVLEQSVAAALLLRDPRRHDGTAYLSLLHTVNDAETLERLLGMAAEAAAVEGCHRLIGPIGLSPYIENGLLIDYWRESPPLNTPYNPPYLPELLEEQMEPFLASQLYQMPIPTNTQPPVTGPARLEPFAPDHLAAEWLPLLLAACAPWQDFPPPDTAEAAFILRWFGRVPLTAWVALMDDQPAGFVLLQPDLAPLLRLAKGGRPWLRRPLLSVAGRWPTRQGRLLLAAVLPQWRGQGIGRQLWQQALSTGRQQGWQTLLIGPLPETAPAANILQHLAVQPRQRYQLYAMST